VETPECGRPHGVKIEEDFAKNVRRSMRNRRNDARKIISFLQKPSLNCAV